MKKQIFLLSLVCFLASCVPCHSQNIAFMNGIASTASGTYSVVVTGKVGHIMVSTNAAFNGSTTTDSLKVGSVNPLTGTITWALAYQNDGVTPCIITHSAGANIYTWQLQNALYHYYKIVYTKGNATLGTVTSVATIF